MWMSVCLCLSVFVCAHSPMREPLFVERDYLGSGCLRLGAELVDRELALDRRSIDDDHAAVERACVERWVQLDNDAD